MPGPRGGGPRGAQDEPKGLKGIKSFYRFKEYFRPVIGIFILDSFFALLIAGVSVATPFMNQFVTKAAMDAAGGAAWTNIFVGIGFLITGLVVRMLSTFFVTYWGHLMGVRMEVSMRSHAVKKMHKLRVSHFDKTSTGTYISRIVTDLKDIPEFAHHGPEDFIIAVAVATGGLTYAFLQSWIIGVILLGIFIAGIFIIYFIRSSWRKIWTTIREFNSRMSASIGQQVEGSSEIKSFASEKYEVARFEELNAGYLKTYKKFYRFEGMFSVSNLVIMSLTSLVTLAIGAAMVANKQINMAQLVGLTSAAAILNQPMQKFVNVYTMISRGSSAVDRFYEFMDLPIEQNKSKTKAPKFKGLIEFKDVDFAYIDKEGNSVDVLKNFNIKIQPGAKIAFVGETGIGKSTILKLILRFYTLNKGKILIDGKDIQSFEINSFRKQIGYIQQQATMFEDTIDNNIRYGRPSATEDEVKQAAHDAYIDDFIEKLSNGYQTMAGPRGAKLSGGQKQRVSIARTFLGGSSVMLMDEATSALDNDTEAKIKASTEKLTKDKTTIIVAHRLSTIKDVDRVIVIGRGGKVLEDGEHKTLMNNKGYYFDLYNK